tara:strand:- start:40261 stop:40734 length:474 start_codon:yes stop_codon:yes gene_type:complete
MQYIQPIEKIFSDSYDYSYPVDRTGLGLIGLGGVPANQPSETPWLKLRTNVGATSNGTIGPIGGNQKRQPFSVVVTVNIPKTTARSTAIYNYQDVATIENHIDSFMLFTVFKPTSTTSIHLDTQIPKRVSNPDAGVDDNWLTVYITYNYEYRYYVAA